MLSELKSYEIYGIIEDKFLEDKDILDDLTILAQEFYENNHKDLRYINEILSCYSNKVLEYFNILNVKFGNTLYNEKITVKIDEYYTNITFDFCYKFIVDKSYWYQDEYKEAFRLWIINKVTKILDSIIEVMEI